MELYKKANITMHTVNPAFEHGNTNTYALKCLMQYWFLELDGEIVALPHPPELDGVRLCAQLPDLVDSGQLLACGRFSLARSRRCR